MKKFLKKGSGASTSIIATIVVALITVVAILAYFSMTTVYVIVANKTIPAGTKITAELLAENAIVQKEINKTFFSDEELAWVIQDTNSLEGQYVQSELKRGKIIYSYDIADRYDIRTNPYLVDNNYEAFALTTGSFSIGKTTNLLEKGDRINIYAVYTLDLSTLKNIKEYETAGGGWVSDDFEGSTTNTIADAYGVKVNELPSYAQEICINAGMDPEDYIYEDEITLAKLMYQNVPIINITKVGDDPTNTSISEMIIAVDSKTAEELLVLMQTGSLSCTLLPYTDGEYTVVDNTGTTDFALQTFGKTFENAQVTE